MSKPKILLFDIETAPAIVATFGLFKQNIGIAQIIEDPRVLAWSAKWYKKGSVKFDSEYHSDYLTMLNGIRDLMDEADILVGYNSDSFDIPWLMGEFIANEIDPPSPSQYVDLYRVSRRNFRWISGKLDYLARRLLDTGKVAHEGMGLWMKCIGPDGDDKDKAWRSMKRYARQDTALLEPLFDKLLPYIRNVNFALYSGEVNACPRCASVNLQRRGEARTTASVFQRFQCTDCGSWSRSAKRESSTNQRPL